MDQITKRNNRKKPKMKFIPSEEIISRLETSMKSEIVEFSIESDNLVQIGLKDGFVSTFDSDWVAEHIEENSFEFSSFGEGGIMLFETSAEYTVWKNQI